MAAQGGAQFRAMHVPVGAGTNIPSKLNSLVANINYSGNISEILKFNLGAS